ncbi:hypothetical protein EJB05_46766, partial [Eragrostis curvula]
MANRGGGRGGKRGGRAGSSSAPEEWVWDGEHGPFTYDPPIQQFPLESKDDFDYATNPIRRYDNRKFKWPKCGHGLDCVVQMFDGQCDGGRRFFRCLNGQNNEDQDNCGFTLWVDPKPISTTVEYISYLQNRIFDLQQELETATPRQSQDLVIGIAGPDTYCLDPYCPCPHHKSGPTNPPPQAPPAPPPPYYGGGGYNDYGYSQSGGQSNYSPWD